VLNLKLRFGKKENGQKREKKRGKFKFSCVRLSPKCVYSGEKALSSPKGKCVSLNLKDYAVRVSDKPQAYAVKDQEKWICFLPRRTKDVPLFPFLIEYARRAVEEQEAAALFLLLDTPCGLARVKVNPQLKLGEKFQIEVLEKEKLQGKVNYQAAFKLNEIAESFRRKPFLVLTNSPAVRDVLLTLVERIAGEEGLKRAEEFVKLVDDPIAEVLSTYGSPNVYVQKELPVKLIAVVLLLVAIAGVGYVYYQKQQEEAARLRARLLARQQQAQKWTPSPVFKRTHVGYYFLAYSGALKELSRALYPPDGFRLREITVSHSGTRVVYETPYPVEGGVKKGDYFVVEKKVPLPSFKWESVRGKPPLTIPPMKEVIGRFAEYIRSVSRSSVDGVPLLSAVVSGDLELSPADLSEFLKKLEKTPFVPEQLTVRLTGGAYRLQFKGKIYGEREER